MGIRETLTQPQYVFPVLRLLARQDWTGRVLTRALVPFNPLDPRRYTNPYEVYEELRTAGGPIFHHERLDNWIISGFPEAEAALRAEVSVDRTEVMEVVWPYKRMDPATLDLLTSVLLTVDPPRHTRLRGLVSRAFTPRAMADLEPRVAEVATELLDDLPGAISGRAGRPNQVDLAEGYASQLPIYVIGELLGLPRTERGRLKELSDIVARFVDPLTGFDPLEMDLAVQELQEIFDHEIERRRHRPTEDMLSVLVSAAEDGDRLTNTELHSMILLLMAAGHETTTGLISNALYWLDRKPDARRQLVATPDLMANAVEEFLRFDSPVQATDRIAAADFTIDGHRITRGSVVTILLGAANRDPRLFDRPEQLVVDRPDPRSLSFGHGIHHCVGAALARMEGRVALSALLDRYPSYRVVHDEVHWKRSITLRGPIKLPAVLR